MHFWRFVLASLAVVSFVACSSHVQAQAPITPGPEHAVLQETVGTWDATMKMPDGSEERGVHKAESTCNGLWIASQFQMEFGGQKFEGRGMDGYDPEKKKYVSVWVDSMSPSVMILEGDFDKKSKTLTMRGEGKGPGGKTTTFKSVTIMKDKNQHTFEMYLLGSDGKEDLMMTIEYRRKS